MPDTDLNVTVDVTGTTASIATDYTTSGVTNAHVQIVKLSYGTPTNATRVTTSTPLPVDIRASTVNAGVTGSVSGLGNFKVINGISGSTTLPLVVSGTTAAGYTPVQINGSVQGITNGVLVGVTGTVSVKDGLRIQGMTSGYPVAITGGRPLSSSTDSVTVSGTVGITGGRYLSQGTDFVRIFGGNAGETMIPVTIRDGSGNSIGSSGGALNVNLIGAGITATVTVGTLVGICQANQNVPLFVAGATAGPAVRVKGTLGGNEAVEVGWSTAQDVNVANTIEVDTTAVIASIQSIQSNELTDIKTNTDNITNIYTKLNGTGVNARITEITKPASVYTGTLTVTGLTGNFISPTRSLKTGITLKAATSNSVSITITGSGSASGYPLGPGETIFIETNTTNSMSFTVPSASGVLHYIAS